MYYMGKIAEQITEEKARILIQEWSNKVKANLKINKPQAPFRNSNPDGELRDGTMFILENHHAISVYWVNENNKETYDVIIAFV